MIRKILENNNINFKQQFSFNDLKYIKKLKFDFAILDNEDNLLSLIEFNGEQHYKFVKNIQKNEDNFKKGEIRDNLKKKYCIDNNINLSIIKYNDNIVNELDKIIHIS